MGAATPMKVGKLRLGFRMCNVVSRIIEEENKYGIENRSGQESQTQFKAIFQYVVNVLVCFKIATKIYMFF